MDRGFHTIAKAPIVLNDRGNKGFKCARSEETDQAAGEQANDIKVVKALLEDTADTGLLAISAKRN